MQSEAHFPINTSSSIRHISSNHQSSSFDQSTMASKRSFLLCFALFALFHASFARQERWQLGECNLERLNARKPDHRIEFEAGRVETWDPNHDQFQCAGVAVKRKTIEQNGLTLPEYSNAPQLVYVVRGRGIWGKVIPGCPETFEDAQGSQQIRGERRSSSRDQHQRVHRFREGDVVALPAGTVNWWHNDGSESVVLIALLDTSNNANQLDANPRSFMLAGNPEEEFPAIQSGQDQYQSRRRYREQGQGEQQGRGFGEKSNVFRGLDTRTIAEALNIDEQLARRLKSENDQRGNIVRVKGDELRVVRPPTLREEESEQSRRREYNLINGMEETYCSLRMKENIGDPSRADLYNPQVGRIATLNSHNLPILRAVRLSAERGTLYNNAMVVPHYNMNAHCILYGIRGRARIQVVDESGRRVFDGEMREGEILTVPQNFAVVKRTDANEKFEYIAFKTNHNAVVTPLAGKTSAIRAMPAAVLASAFDISMQEAQRIKFSTPEATLTSARSEAGRREIA